VVNRLAKTILHPGLSLSGRDMTLKSTCPSCKGSISIPEELFGRSFICPKCKTKLQSSSFDPEMIVAFTPTPSPSPSPSDPPPIQSVGQEKVETQKTRQSPTPSNIQSKQFSPRLLSSIAILILVGISLAIFFYSNSNLIKISSENKPPVTNVGEDRGNQQFREDQANRGAKDFGLFQPQFPEVTTFTYFKSVRVDRFFIHGFDVFLDVKNPRNQAIESMILVLQDRTVGRTVPNSKTQIGGNIRGGIEPNSKEGINIFVPKDKLGLSATQFQLPDDSILEVAIKEVRFVDGEVLDLSDRLTFKDGSQTPPDEDHILKERRKTDPGLEFTESMEAFWRGEQPKKQ